MRAVIECLEPTFGTFVIAGKVIYEGDSKHQHILLFENKKYGRVLRLDNAFQTSEYDEFTYHEPLVHPAMCSHPCPKKVLVIGGGDGGALEEVLKHNTVERAVMVELDEKVVEVSRKYLRKINKGAFDDRRVELVIGDGVDYIRESDEKFDAIVLDLTDPYSISTFLYTKEFYAMVAARLSVNGVLSLHAETPYAFDQIHRRVAKTLAGVFRYARFFYNYVPIYGTLIGFANCSNSIDPKGIRAATVRKRLAERNVGGLKMYGPEMHESFMLMSQLTERMIKNPAVKEIRKESAIREYERLDEKSVRKIIRRTL
ncbi:MAG: polyamine aminopropyltransferase [Candidatus Micrarchaeia archaeon]